MILTIEVKKLKYYEMPMKNMLKHMLKRYIALAIDEFIIIIFDAILCAKIGLTAHYAIPIYIFVAQFKDIFGASIGKRIFKYKVVMHGEHTKPSVWRLVLRNLTLLIWPVDVVVSLRKNGRRLGDIWMGTEVVQAKKKQDVQKA